MKTIPIIPGTCVLVDDEDFGFLSQWKWYALRGNRTWYAIRTEFSAGKHTTIYMHRVIAGAKPGENVDHVDGNGCHNWRANLRVATARQNGRNRTHKQIGCSSKFKGVIREKRADKWRARIRAGNIGPNGLAKTISLGLFDSEIDAAYAYDSAARKYFGPFAALNFPDREPSPVRPEDAFISHSGYNWPDGSFEAVELLLKIEPPAAAGEEDEAPAYDGISLCSHDGDKCSHDCCVRNGEHTARTGNPSSNGRNGDGQV